jgi:hypothetical protein
MNNSSIEGVINMKSKMNIRVTRVALLALFLVGASVLLPAIASATPGQSAIPNLLTTGQPTVLKIESGASAPHSGTEIAVWDAPANPLFPTSCPLPGASGGIKWELRADTDNDGDFTDAGGFSLVSYNIPAGGSITITDFGNGGAVTIAAAGGATFSPAAPSGGFKWQDVTGGAAGTDSTSQVGQYEFASCGKEGAAGLSNFVGTTTFDVIKPTIEWEKRDGSVSAPHPLQGGATFTITPNPFTGTGSLDVTDNDANDADPDNGQFNLSGVLFDTYTIVEKTPPAGYIADPDSRSVTVSQADPFPVIGTQGTDDDVANVNERDFHNTRKGTIEWEKRDGSVSAPHPLQGGATFTITPNPFTGSGSLDVTDNDANDADPDNGQFNLSNVIFGTYTIVEKTPPAGYIADPDSRSVTVSGSEPNPVIGTQGIDDDVADVNERDFHNTITRPCDPAGEGCKVTGWGLLGPKNNPEKQFKIFAYSKFLPSGTVEVKDNVKGLTIKSIQINSVTTVIGTPKNGTITGLATVNGAGSYSFTVNVVDAADPGAGQDTFSISLPGYSGGYLNSGTLSMGDIQVVK